MAKKKKRIKEADDEDYVGVSLPRRIFRLIITLIVACVILYIAVLVISRTDGYRSYMAQQLSDTFQLNVSLEKAAVAPDFSLKLRGIKGTKGDEGPLLLDVKKILLTGPRLGFFRPFKGNIKKITLKGGGIIISKSDQGWHPSILGPVAETAIAWIERHQANPIEQVSTVSKLPAGSTSTQPGKRLKFRNARISLEDFDVIFENPRGKKFALFHDLFFETFYVQVLERGITHVLIKATRLDFPNGGFAHNLEYEMLRTGDKDIVLVSTARWENPVPIRHAGTENPEIPTQGIEPGEPAVAHPPDGSENQPKEDALKGFIRKSLEEAISE